MKVGVAGSWRRRKPRAHQGQNDKCRSPSQLLAVLSRTIKQSLRSTLLGGGGTKEEVVYVWGHPLEGIVTEGTTISNARTLRPSSST